MRRYSFTMRRRRDSCAGLAPPRHRRHRMAHSYRRIAVSAVALAAAATAIALAGPKISTGSVAVAGSGAVGVNGDVVILGSVTGSRAQIEIQTTPLDGVDWRRWAVATDPATSRCRRICEPRSPVRHHHHRRHRPDQGARAWYLGNHLRKRHDHAHRARDLLVRLQRPDNASVVQGRNSAAPANGPRSRAHGPHERRLPIAPLQRD